jgi:hypothetical protein
VDISEQTTEHKQRRREERVTLVEGAVRGGRVMMRVTYSDFDGDYDGGDGLDVYVGTWWHDRWYMCDLW